MIEALILFGHGARDPAWAQPLERLREAVLRGLPQADVRLAFLEFMTPTLTEAIDDAVAAGARRIVVVPVFLAQGGHVRRDVPAVLEAALARHPGLKLRLCGALGEAQEVIDAMAEVVLEGLARQ